MPQLLLSQPSVVEAGAGLVRRLGWQALSLRAVAGELGVTPMALYRHIGESESLRQAVVEVIVGSMSPVGRSGSVADELADWARRLHAHLAEYPGVAGYLLTNWFESPGILEQIDDLLGLAHESGIEGFEAVAVVNALFTYVLMRCEAERSVRNAGTVRRSLRTAAASRPLDRLTALSAHYTTAQFDAHFEFGLTALMAGMQLVEGARSRTQP